jgi:hypothetical protein
MTADSLKNRISQSPIIPVSTKNPFILPLSPGYLDIGNFGYRIQAVLQADKANAR